MEDDIIFGVDITVLLPYHTEKDALGNAETAYKAEVVHNVLIAPTSANDLDKTHPDGYKDTTTFHIPKTFTKSLRGARIVYQEQTYKVIGDPEPYMPSLTPGAWNRPVQGARVDG